MKFPTTQPIDITMLTEEQLNAELERGYADVTAGPTRDANAVFTKRF